MALTKNTFHIVSGILIVLSLALLVLGLRGPALLWQIGLVVVAVAMLLSLGSRWAPDPPQDDQE